MFYRAKEGFAGFGLRTDKFWKACIMFQCEIGTKNSSSSSLLNVDAKKYGLTHFCTFILLIHMARMVHKDVKKLKAIIVILDEREY